MEIVPFPKYPKSDPQFFYSKNKTPGSPIIVFVHFYGGVHRILKRHINLVNELGYDAFAYNMPDFAGLRISMFYRGRFGLKHLYARMLNYYLNQIPGKKIIFAFSNPSAAAIEVIYDRKKENREDVVGLICDSGPSRVFFMSIWNLAVKALNRYTLMMLFAFFWSFRLHHEIRYQLRRFPKNFPILSIRGGADTVIPPWHIDKVFHHLQPYVNVKVVTFAEAEHLDALKRHPKEYKKALQDWFSGLSL